MKIRLGTKWSIKGYWSVMIDLNRRQWSVIIRKAHAGYFPKSEIWSWTITRHRIMYDKFTIGG